MKKVTKKKSVKKPVKSAAHYNRVNELTRTLTKVANERDQARQWGYQLNAEAYETSKKLVLSEQNVASLIKRVTQELEKSSKLEDTLNAARTRITDLLNHMAVDKKKSFIKRLFGA